MNFLLIILSPLVFAIVYGLIQKKKAAAILLACSLGCAAALFYGIRHLGSWFGGADIGFGLIILYSPIITVPCIFLSYYFSRLWSDQKNIVLSIVIFTIWILLSFGYNYTIYLAEKEYRKKSEINCTELPYHCAVQKKDLASMDLFKQKAVSLELKDGFGQTALIRAMYDHEIVKKLLDLGANPNTASDDGTTPLFYALILQNDPNFESAKSLILFGARVNELFSVYGDSKKMTVLNYTITQGKMDAVEFLLRNGADPLIRDEYGYNGCERMKMSQNETQPQMLLKFCD